MITLTSRIPSLVAACTAVAIACVLGAASADTAASHANAASVNDGTTLTSDGAASAAQDTKPAAPTRPDTRKPTGAQPATPPAPAAKDAGVGDDSDMQAMMEKVAELSAPGTAHARIAKLAGTWKVEGQWWLSADAEPSPFAGTMSAAMVLGGRFLKGDVIGEPMGPPDAPRFEGIMYWGYDNVLKQWNSTWMDNMNTSIAFGTSRSPADAKSLEWATKMTDSLTGTAKTMREVLTIESDDRFVSEAFDKGADGKEFRSMRVVYTRVK